MTHRKEPELRGDVLDLAIAQFLDLAKSANVNFEVIEGRLVMRSSRVDWERWSTVRHFLDELGIEAINEFFKRNGPEHRAVLAAAA